MNLLLNGEQRIFEEGITIGSLLEHLNLQSARVVLELNRQILNADESAATLLSEGDQLEIIQFVGGG